MFYVDSFYSVMRSVFGYSPIEFPDVVLDYGIEDSDRDGLNSESGSLSTLVETSSLNSSSSEPTPSPTHFSSSPSSSYGRRGDRSDYLEDPIYQNLERAFGQRIAESIYLNNVVLPHSVLRRSEETGRWELAPPLPADFDVEAELHYRARFLQEHQELWSALTRKCPELHYSELRQREFKQHLSGIYRCPEIFTKGEGQKEVARLKNVETFLRELIYSSLSDADIDFLMGVAMKQFAPVVSFHNIEEGSRLMALVEQVKLLVRRNQLTPDQNYQGEDKIRFLIRDENSNVYAKYKPLEPVSARHEQIGYLCDQALGAGMTCSTGWASLSMEKELKDIALLYRKNRDAALARFQDIPENVQQMVYFAVYKTVKPSQHEISSDFGKDYFFGRIKGSLIGNLPSDDLDVEMRFNCSKAILNCLKMPQFRRWQFRSSLERGPPQGVLQFWQNGAVDVKDMLERSRSAGSHLRQIPVTICHWYALLGLVKGSYDGHLGNTLLRLPTGQVSTSSSSTSDETGPASQGPLLIDCDDEMILTSENTFINFRMWQFGLPQNDIPFSKPELQLIVGSDLLAKIKGIYRYNSYEVPTRILRTQEERVQKIVNFCQEELSKEIPTLTPRELFFLVVGSGRGRFKHYSEKGYAPIFIFDCLMLAQPNENYYNELMRLQDMPDKLADLYTVETEVKDSL